MSISYVNTIYKSLPNKVKALSVENADGGYTIFVNKNISFEAQLEAVKHEMLHISKLDFEKYNVGAIEQEAHAIYM